MKIVLVSDTHGNNEFLDWVASQHKDADYFFHCGDSQSTSSQIFPFQSVRGNCDYFSDFPDHIKIPVEDGYIWIQHHPFNETSILIKNNVKYFIHGHTHKRRDEMIDGIRFINPGAVSGARDTHELSYALLMLTKNENRLLFCSGYTIKVDSNTIN